MGGRAEIAIVCGKPARTLHAHCTHTARPLTCLPTLTYLLAYSLIQVTTAVGRMAPGSHVYWNTRNVPLVEYAQKTVGRCATGRLVLTNLLGFASLGSIYLILYLCICTHGQGVQQDNAQPADSLPRYERAGAVTCLK